MQGQFCRMCIAFGTQEKAIAVTIETQKLWQPLAQKLIVPYDNPSYQKLAEQPFGKQATASGSSLERYETENIPELPA